MMVWKGFNIITSINLTLSSRVSMEREAHSDNLPAKWTDSFTFYFQISLL